MLLRSCPLASLLIVVVIALSLVPAAVSDCRVAVNQTTRAAAASGRWTSGDFVFQIFDLQLSNPGDQPLSSILLDIDLSSSSSTDEDNSANSSAIAQFWNLVRLSANGSVISFSAPAAFGAIQPGASLGAGYIVRAHVPSTSASSSSSSSSSTFSVAEPNVTVISTSCDGTPGGGGAVPTATPAVATPAPAAESGCNASATIEARTAATGSWRDGDGRAFQIYDVRTTNTGTRPITGAVVTIAGLSSGANVTQFWELGSPQQPQQGATADSTGETSTVFPIVFGYGPIQPGAWQGAGFVVATPAAAADTAAAPANLTATLSGLACA